MLKLGELIFRPDQENPPKSSIKLVAIPKAVAEPCVPPFTDITDVIPITPIPADEKLEAANPVDPVDPVVTARPDESAIIVDIDDSGHLTNGDAPSKILSFTLNC